MFNSSGFWLKLSCISFFVALLASCGAGDVGGSANPLFVPSKNSKEIVVPPKDPQEIAAQRTAEQLNKFWDRYGAADSFPPMYVEVLSQLLHAEDLVIAKNYQAARKIVDAILTKYPLADQGSWWDGIYRVGQNKATRPHLGEPGAYAHLRMLDDITKIGVTKVLAGSKPLNLAVLLPVCSDIVPNSGPTQMNHPLSPEIKANDYEAVRQSLRLFQSYVLAITGGELRLEVTFHNLNKCYPINGNALSYTQALSQLPAGVEAASDMFWLIYPLDYESGQSVTSKSGLIYHGNKGVFLSEDDWLIKKPAEQGGGVRTEVERRMYLPEWVQHEFFHYLFSRWPEMQLEKTSHQWFQKANWPIDFVGTQEEDYYSEALNKRFYQANPSISQKIKNATVR